MEAPPTSHGNIIPHEHVLTSTSRPKIAIGPRSKTRSTDVRVIRNGDRVDVIEVQCSCGEVIRIQCDYEN